VNRPRQFKEIADLYSNKMTSVYSGGVVYEYSQEKNDFGILDIKGGTVAERPEFSILQDAFKKTPAPSGDGGYKQDGKASECPPINTSSWVIKNNTVPAMPSGAKKFMDQGAGKGKGLITGDDGSQWAGTPSGSWETPGNSGSSTPSKTKTSGAGQVVPMLLLTFVGFVVQFALL
jgi:hypothetical protein